MALTPELIQRPSLGNAPGSVQLPLANDFEPQVIAAVFNGAAAAGDFLPCLSIYSPNGTLLSRTFPDVVTGGDTASVTYSPSLSDVGGANAATPFHLISAASTNATLVAGGARDLTGYYLVNTGAAFAYVKLYDKASSPTVGTDVPAAVLGVPAASAANLALGVPVEFALGLGLAITAGIADGDSSAVGASQVAVTLYYR